jgi:hypothetical protein
MVSVYSEASSLSSRIANERCADSAPLFSVAGGVFSPSGEKGASVRQHVLADNAAALLGAIASWL